MELNLKNPIIFFDLETTGLNITADKIVELIKSGATNEEIVDAVASAYRDLEKVERVRSMYRDVQFKDSWRELEVTYIFFDYSIAARMVFCSWV